MYEGLQEIQKDETDAARRTAYVFLRKSSDHVSPYNTTLTSKTIPLSKNGGAQAASTAYITAIDTTNLPGAYKLVLTEAEVDTLGYLLVHGKVAGTSCEGATLVRIVAYDPFTQGAQSSRSLKIAEAQPA